MSQSSALGQLEMMSEETWNAGLAVPAPVAAAAASPPPAADAAAAARAFSPIDDGSEFAASPAPAIPAAEAEDLSILLSSPSPAASPSRRYEEIGSDDDENDDRASSVLAASTDRSASDDGQAEGEAADDDELTILAVRRALHIPAHPQRRAPPRRIVHSPVNLLDDDDEAPAPAAAAAASSSSAAAAAASPAAAASDEEADVCAICLSVPTDLCIPSACKHPFCFACLEQWTKIQMTSIYAAAEQARYNEAMGGWIAQGSSAAKDKKSHPSCPMCKREYTAIRKMVVINAPASSAAASSSAAAAASPPPLPTVDSPFESIPVSIIVPPPFQYHRPTLSFNNPAYAHNEHFRQAAEAALNFAMRTGAGLARQVIEGALWSHPRVNALLLAFPPYRENLRQIKKDLIDQVLATRENYNRGMGAQAQQQQSYQRQRQQMLAMDHGGGLMPEPLPMMSDSNASAYLLNRLGPQGSAALLSVAFGQELPPPVTNPILQLYRESRYQGGITHQLGRMRMWSDLSIQHVPPQPDVIWALRQAGVGAGNRTPFTSVTQQHAGVGADQAAAASSSSSAAGAAAAPAPTLASWLNIELSSILATRHESVSPATHEHFLVSLVLSYLELLLSRLEMEERQQKLERENRAEGQQRRKRQRLERAAAAAAAAGAAASGSLEAASSSSSAAAAALPPTVSRSQPPPLSDSFVPSYRASSSSLHPLSDDAPTQLAPIEAAGPPPDAENDVQIVRERRREPSGPRRSPSEAEIIHLSDDEDNAQAVAAADSEILPSSSSSTARRSPVQSGAHLPGGHLHSLFALSAPLTSSVDFLFHKLEEFLKGLTGVFVHRTLLWILGRAYASPGAGPAVGDPRRAPSAEEVRARQLIESSMAEALQQARDQWRVARGGTFGDAPSSSPSMPLSVAAAASSSPASSSSAAAAAVALSDTGDAVVPSAAASAPDSRPHRSSSSTIREKRAARLGGGQRAPRSGSGSGAAAVAERKERERPTTPAAAAATSARTRDRPAANGFMASVFGTSSAPAAARSTAVSAAAAHSSSSSSAAAARPLRPPPSVASSVASSPDRSHSSGSAAPPPTALSPVHFTGPDADGLASAERRYTEEDNAFISGMRSSKRPRARALEV